jgi:hypothetical protein
MFALISFKMGASLSPLFFAISAILHSSALISLIRRTKKCLILQHIVSFCDIFIGIMLIILGILNISVFINTPNDSIYLFFGIILSLFGLSIFIFHTISLSYYKKFYEHFFQSPTVAEIDKKSLPNAIKNEKMVFNIIYAITMPVLPTLMLLCLFIFFYIFPAFFANTMLCILIPCIILTIFT